MSNPQAIALVVNGISRSGHPEPRVHLADFLRHEFHLTGTHLGCEHGVCGACTVLVDGALVRSCLMLAVQANGCEITTVEGLVKSNGALAPLQEAFRRRHALQCGFCTPGMLMTLEAFIRDNPDADEQQVREAISGNLCRCTGYDAIILAALDILGQRRTGAAAAE